MRGRFSVRLKEAFGMFLVSHCFRPFKRHEWRAPTGARLCEPQPAAYFTTGFEPSGQPRQGVSFYESRTRAPLFP